MDAFIKRTRHESNFTIINNCILKDKTMSLESKGLLCYILHLPYDWVVKKSALQKELNLGRRVIDRIFTEIESAGYLVSSDYIHGEDGKFKEKIYLFYDVSQLPVVQNEQTDTVVQNDTTVKHDTVVHLPLSQNVHLLSTNNKKVLNKQSTKFPELENSGTEGDDVSVTVNEKDNRKKSVYTLCVEYWLDIVHPGWNFRSLEGKKMKSIITQLKQTLKSAGKEVNDDAVLNSFIYFCQNLPDWFKNKDLSTIDSKFNEIVEQIREKQKQQKTEEFDPATHKPKMVY